MSKALNTEYVIEYRRFRVRVALCRRHLRILSWIAERGAVSVEKLRRYELELIALWLLGLVNISESEVVSITPKGRELLEALTVKVKAK